MPQLRNLHIHAFLPAFILLVLFNVIYRFAGYLRFLANLGLFATAAIKLCCALLLLGIFIHNLPQLNQPLHEPYLQVLLPCHKCMDRHC
jgi:hypothetical protein